ncbi:hypothetical protein [Actinomadura sp. NBRC 104412]|uniref:hypothetical protein n=1 Tax=Actinomadura sp. NBRC 104412 TaxID=3032203 RepID=UPI002554692C|nr:hypothetical protein [Actinomadura sp. NBRC 104412]
MPAALADGGLKRDAVGAVVTHNPFAVNDAYFSRATGFPMDWMNVASSSLIYGHPQGPTGARAVAELIEILRARGGGIGLFTGCAAGDTG